MQVNLVNILFTAIIVLIDIILSIIIKEKGVFLIISKSHLRIIIAVILLVFLAYSILNEEYLLFIFGLSLLKIIDKILFLISQKNKTT